MLRRTVNWLILFAVAFGFTFHYRQLAGPGYPLDDSYIHFAYARNLANGNGFGINEHQPTPGATSPLWVLLLSIGFAFGAGAHTWPRVIGAVIMALCGLAACTLCRALTPESPKSRYAFLFELMAGVTVASGFPLVWSAAGGMEAPLIGLTTLCALLALHTSRNKSPKYGALWGACAGLAAAARPEGMLLIPAFAACELMFGGERKWPRAAAGAATGTALLLPYVAFCIATTGRWFPNTYYAKTLSTRSHLPSMSALTDLLGVAWMLFPWLFFAIPVIVFVSAAMWRRDQALASVVAGTSFALALPMSYASMERSELFAGGAGNFGRYLFPMFPPLAALGFAALSRLVARPIQSQKRKMTFALAMMAALACVGSTWRQTFDYGQRYYRQNVSDINQMQVRMADVLAKQLPQNSLVAANDVGALAFLTNHRVLDLVGIVSTEVLNVRRPLDKPPPANEEDVLLKLLFDRKPEALVIFPSWYPTIYQRLRRGLTVMDDVYVPECITSAENRLVAYRVDWSGIEPLDETSGNELTQSTGKDR